MDISGINLTGQNALVTGGGRGIGRAMALALAKHGARVAVTARSQTQLDETVKQIEALGGHAIGIAADVTQPDSVAQMAAEVENQLDPIHLLVNNAGHGSTPTPVHEADPNDWWWTFTVNVRGVMLCTHAVLRGMIERKTGRIINVTSGAGNRTIPNATAYVTSKAAVMRFSDTLAAEVKPHGISVFTIHPGTVWTEMTQFLVESESGKTWMPWFSEIFEKGQDVPPELSAELVVYLASGQADILTGRFISVADDVAGLVQDGESIISNDRRVLRLM